MRAQSLGVLGWGSMIASGSCAPLCTVAQKFKDAPPTTTLRRAEGPPGGTEKLSFGARFGLLLLDTLLRTNQPLLHCALAPGLAFRFSLRLATDQSDPFIARPVGMVGLGRSSEEKLHLPGLSISDLEREEAGVDADMCGPCRPKAPMNMGKKFKLQLLKKSLWLPRRLLG